MTIERSAAGSSGFAQNPAPGTEPFEHQEFEHQFEQRKRDHIQHSLDPAHQASGFGGLERVHLVHEALPDLDFEEIRLDSVCLGKPTATPFYVAGMTAGHADAPKINRELALACQARGWVMGVGSQRRELSDAVPVDTWRELRAEVPRLILLANLGVAQILTARVEQILRIVERIEAQALMVHFNALQEALQPEGTPQFRGAWNRLKELVQELGRQGVPVGVKETGCGFSRATLERLSDLGLAAIDLSGLGGTHWGRIEGARAQSGSLQANAAQTFAGWGESTVDSVLSARHVFSSRKNGPEIWASGGVRSGLDAAKLIALGAHRVGYAKPALEEALRSSEAVQAWMAQQEFELKVALFCTGSRSPEGLRNHPGAARVQGSTALSPQQHDGING